MTASSCPSDVQFLVGIFCATAGQDGENLGSDAADVISVNWVAVSVAEAKVVLVHRSVVQPSDVSKVTPEILEERGITEDLSKCPSLQETIAWFDSYIVSQLGSVQTVLVTDGPNPLRQVLFPEASRKGFGLSDFYRTFFDVRRDFRRLFNNNESINSVTDILKGLQCFHESEVIKAQLEYGICTKCDVIDSNTVVRARGLPWQSSDHDVAKFFVGLNIAKGGVALCLSQQGRRNGEALVRFESVEQRDLALRRHRHFMGNRYIEVYRATGEDFIGVAAGNSNEAQQFLSKGAAVIIRMRGLPYDCTAQQIVDFFQTGERSVEVLDGADGILFVNKADGRSTGDAFVLVAKEEEAEAALARHKDLIGTRYIELFRSTTAEVQQVVSKSLEPPKLDQPGSNGLQPGVLGAVPQPNSLTSPIPGMLAQQVIIQGSRKDCIRLRGLPYEAQVQNILDFLGEYSKHIIYQGVHMVYNAQGHPSGEAFIQMDTEQSAAACANDRHNKYMQMGKKQRYIEVFQCSADDMSMVLTGPGAIPTTPVISPTRQLISPVSNGGLIPGQAGLFPGSNGFSQQQFLNPQIFNAALGQNNTLALQTALAAAAQRYPILPMSGLVSPIMYWPYPSPPVSPTGYFAAPQATAQSPGLVLMRGIPFNASVVDVMAFFQNFPELNPDCIQLQRTPEGRPTGEALIVFPTRGDAERAVIEKNRHLLGMRPIELYLYNV